MFPIPTILQYGNTVVPTGQKVTKVQTGQNHVAILVSDGTVYTRGMNSQGQLGVGDMTTRTTWSKVNSNCIDLYCTGTATVIKKNTGAWEFTGYGLAVGYTGGNVSTFTDCTSIFNSITSDTSGTSILDMKCTFNSILALRSDNTLWGIGINSKNELGFTGAANTSFKKATLPSGLVPTKIYSGYQLFGACNSDGTFYYSGEFFGTTASSTPVTASTFTQYNIAGSALLKCVDFSAHGIASYFITKNSNTNAVQIYTGGQNFYGELANNLDNSSYTAMAAISNPGSFTPQKLFRGFSYYSQHLITSGSVYASGYNIASSYNGKLGVGTSTNPLVYTKCPDPVTISTYSDISIYCTISRSYMLYNGILYSSGTETTYSKDTTSLVFVKDQPSI